MNHEVSKEWIFAIVLIFALLLVFIIRTEESNDIKRNGVLVQVKIVDRLIPSRGGGSFNFRCSFSFNGEQKDIISPTSVKENGSKYIGKICPALYSPKKNILRILLRPEDFEEYNISLTDSLIIEINKLAE